MHSPHRTASTPSFHLPRLLLALGLCAGVSFGQPTDDEVPLRVYPLTSKTVHIVSNRTGGAAGTDEKLIYDNPLGNVAVELQASLLLSDDLTLAVRSGCPLRSYRLQVIGKADPDGCGGPGASCGPVTINFELLSECPGAGGTPIEGTAGCVSNDPTRTDCLPLISEFDVTEVEFVVPQDQEILLPGRVWLGVWTSRQNAGVVVGAPALVGYSDDVIDYPGFPCNASFGGFPSQPHASFHASVYGDTACADAFPTYQNIRTSQPGVNAGANNCIADDIQVNRTCRMVEMEVGLRGSGIYDLELREGRPAEPFAPSVPIGDCKNGRDSMNQFAIPGTYRRFLVTTSGATVRRFTFDPPVDLPEGPIFAVLVPNNIYATWILTGKDAAIGSTSALFWKWQFNAWQSVLPSNNNHGGLQLTITCDGQPPTGACCDMLTGAEEGDATCREVADFNCPTFFASDSFNPPWQEAMTCADDPFPLPCGKARCCLPDDSCENLTYNECAAIDPVYGPRFWKAGEYCEDREKPCPFAACVDNIGTDNDCQVPHEGPGCGDPFCCDEICQFDYWCCAVQWDELCAQHSLERTEDCNSKPTNDECVPTNYTLGAIDLVVNDRPVAAHTSSASTSSLDSFCCYGGLRYCNGGCSPGGGVRKRCHEDSDCRGADDGYCDFPEDLSLTGQCVGGCNAGLPCVYAGGYGPETVCTSGINGGHPCKPRCINGARDTEPCGNVDDCPGGIACDGTIDCGLGVVCDNSFCEGTEDGVCAPPVPEPGNPGYGSLWYRFTVPDNGKLGGTANIEVSTCDSLPPASDSLLNVYAVGDTDRGLCGDLGQCGDGSMCRVSLQDCDDHTICHHDNRQCSLASQDCPSGFTCILDGNEACNHLSPIGCNDDALDACGETGSPYNSKICLTDLKRGQTYYVLLAAKTAADQATYKIGVREVDACAAPPDGTCVAGYCAGGTRSWQVCTVDDDCTSPEPPANDYCSNAIPLPATIGETVVPFDLASATFDCDVAPCNTNLHNDIWYTWTAPAEGTVDISTCADGTHDAPDTEMMIYFGCSCPPSTWPPPLCYSNSMNSACITSASTNVPLQVSARDCLAIRLGDNRGFGGIGDMTVDFTPTPPCDPGQLIADEPANGTIDAGWDSACMGREVGVKTVTVSAPPNNAAPECWTLCESGTTLPDGTELPPNHIVDVEETSPSRYALALARPITPGQCTTISYNAISGDPASVTFRSLPGDVNASGVTHVDDVLGLIDVINGLQPPAWGTYSTDVDRSGATNPGDILAVIDAINGAGSCAPWLNVGIPEDCGPCAGP